MTTGFLYLLQRFIELNDKQIKGEERRKEKEGSGIGGRKQGGTYGMKKKREKGHRRKGHGSK